MTFSNRPLSHLSRILAVAALGLVALLTGSAHASAATRTPLTVYNVCHLNTRLGHIYETNVNGTAVAYWDNNRDGLVDFMAYSDDGNSSVDVAAVTNSDGSVADVAYCTQRNWISAPRYESNPSSYQPSMGTFISEEACVAADIGGLNPIGPDYQDTVGSPYESPTCIA